MNALRLYIPTEWVKLNKKQLLFMASLYVYNHGETDFLTKAFLFLSGLKLTQQPATSNQQQETHFYTHPSHKKPIAIDDELMAQLTDKCRYLLEIGEIRPISWIKGTRARHYRLYNVCFEEYLMAENYYFAYTKTREKAHLNHLVAVLYRYPWQRWNAGKIQRRAQKFAKLPDEVRNSVFMWYVGFRGYIPRRCPTLFSGGSSAKVDVRNYINGLVHTLNGGDITRNNTLLAQPMWFALDELEQRAKEAEEIKEKK